MVITRREIVRIMGAGALPFLAGTWPGALAQAPARKYELLLKGGRVIDPSQSLNAVADVALTGGRIAAIAPDIDPRDADRTVPVTGQLVTPGLVDLHTHGFAGISHWGVDLDQYCIARGVTTAIDAGTSGSDSFEGFRRLVIEPVAHARPCVPEHLACGPDRPAGRTRGHANDRCALGAAGGERAR